MEPHIDSPDLLWNAIRGRLDTSLPAWRKDIEHFGQAAAVERRAAGHQWTDDEVFEALLRAILSNNTDWAKIERVLPELRDAFAGYSLRKYAESTKDEVQQRFVPWFKARRAGSMTLKQSLIGLADTARIVRNWSDKHGSAEAYFASVIADCEGDPKRAAVALGQYGSRSKLPAFGIPLAAESLRNLGFDVCKPDRHICRAVGSFKLVEFQKWADRTRNKPPAASDQEMLKTMTVVEALARSVGLRTSFLDNAIWLLCAQSGLGTSNEQLARLALASGTSG